jgi:hypothetical protein
MTMRNRQILVAAGLVVLAIWLAVTWVGSSAPPEPSPGPSPTGAIGSAPLTFEPSDGAATSSPAATTATPGDPAEMVGWIEFRETYGLRTDIPWVLQVANDPQSTNDTGVPLLAWEMTAIGDVITATQDLLPLLRAYGNAHPEAFAGVIIDGARAVIFVTGDLAPHRESLANLLPPTAPYEVRSTPLSRQELQALAGTFAGETAWFRSIGAEFVGANVGSTGVRVRYLAANDRVGPLILAHFGNPSWMRVQWEGPLPWQGPRGTLVIRVMDAIGRPVVGATCETSPIDPSVDADMGVAFVTNKEGTCTIKNLPATAFKVGILPPAESPGAPIARSNVTARANATVEAVVQLGN